MFRHVQTTCVNKLEARYERSCVNLKVFETRSTFTFTRTCYFIHCFYSIYARKIYVRTNVLRDSENPPLVRRLFWIVKQTIMLYFLEKRVYNLEMLRSPSLPVEEKITLSYLDSFFGKGRESACQQTHKLHSSGIQGTNFLKKKPQHTTKILDWQLTLSRFSTPFWRVGNDILAQLKRFIWY